MKRRKMNKVIFSPPLDERVTTHVQPGGGVIMSMRARDGRVVRVCGELAVEQQKRPHISVTVEMGMVLLFEARR
jgi:hypothetical protein